MLQPESSPLFRTINSFQISTRFIVRRELRFTIFAFNINTTNDYFTVFKSSTDRLDTREKRRLAVTTERIREYGFIFGPELAVNGVKRTSGHGQRVKSLELRWRRKRDTPRNVVNLGIIAACIDASGGLSLAPI